MGILQVLQNDPILIAAIRKRKLAARGYQRMLLGKIDGDVTIYRQMVEDNLQHSELYRQGKFWAHHNKRHAQAIYGGGLRNLRDEFFNRTFSGPMPESRQSYDALLWLYLKHVRNIDTEDILSHHQDTEIGGNCDQTIFDGKKVSLDFLQSLEECYLIQQSWLKSGRRGSPNVICELGAGYGRVAYVAKLIWPDCTYIILDLPEALSCARSWLSRVMPDDTSDYGGELEMGNGKVQLHLPHKIEEIPEKSVDAFVNIYSFAEMPPASIKNYFAHVDRITEGIVLSKQRKVEKNTEDGSLIDSYPIPGGWRELIYEDATLYPNFFQSTYAT